MSESTIALAFDALTVVGFYSLLWGLVPFSLEIVAEIVRLGNIRREKMPGRLANAGYFHLFQQVLFYYPDGKHKLHEWMEKEFRLWCDVIGRSVEQGELRGEIDIQEAAALFRQVFIGLSYQMSFSDGLDVGILRKRFLYIYGLLKR